MRAIFFSTHASISNLQHVRIIPCSWTSISCPFVIDISQSCHAFPCVLNVSCGSPTIAN
nr:hypothetical protein Iba_chr03aCG0090 [Ipomoea batatas]